ncbi:bola protein [Cantharellus anzutake]|uniref:bola protein n=1 Tax=Cantharellus anzutake TaxID=1750568 RepID=UPI001908EA12|nr:bola protein [Cantharellus anzutake]KAF8342034.1 bola protein [Cantharellus anzutake]
MLRPGLPALARTSTPGRRFYDSLFGLRTSINTLSRNSFRTYGTTDQGQNLPPVTEGEQQIINKLKARFHPSRLVVQDVSGGCGTFYAINISSSAFKGLPTVKQHRLVTQELKEEVASIHGLQLKTIPE